MQQHILLILIVVVICGLALSIIGLHSIFPRVFRAPIPPKFTKLAVSFMVLWLVGWIVRDSVHRYQRRPRYYHWHLHYSIPAGVIAFGDPDVRERTLEAQLLEDNDKDFKAVTYNRAISSEPRSVLYFDKIANKGQWYATYSTTDRGCLFLSPMPSGQNPADRTRYLGFMNDFPDSPMRDWYPFEMYRTE